jgi:hypothetical protein
MTRNNLGKMYKCFTPVIRGLQDSLSVCST